MKKYSQIVVVILLCGMIAAECVMLWGQMQEVADSRQQYSDLVSGIAQQEEEVESLEEVRDDIQSQLDLFEREKQEKESVMADLEETLESVNGEKEELERDLETAKTEQASLEQLLESLESRINALEAELQE